MTSIPAERGMKRLTMYNKLPGDSGDMIPPRKKNKKDKESDSTATFL
jgi:hypothetical protein